MRPASTELLERLIGFRTVSSESNLALVDWTGDYLAGHGAEVRRTFDDERRKANIFATFGTGADGIVLSGHTDVVPTAGQSWSSDPFVADERDGRIYGRGACDMKGFIAAALSLVPRLAERNDSRPVHFALSYDEEVGCLGARRMLADIGDAGIRPRGCIVGEPTDMRVVVGHKGAGMYAFSVRGRAAHSSLAPRGVNAVEYGVRVASRILALADRLREREERHVGYDVPYSTIQVNRMNGGGAGNIVADSCDFLVDVRSLPWTNQEGLLAEIRAYIDDELLPEMQSIAPESAIGFRRVGDVPAFETQPTEEIVTTTVALSPHSQCAHVAFGSEAGLFQTAGVPTVICGPGSIEQAHRPDEFVSLDQLFACERMLRGILKIAT